MNFFKLYKRIFQQTNKNFALLQHIMKQNPEFVPFIDKIIDWYVNNSGPLYGMFRYVLNLNHSHLFVDSLISLISYEILDDGGITYQYRKYFMILEPFDDENFDPKIQEELYGPKDKWIKDTQSSADNYFYIILDPNNLPQDKDYKLVICRSEDNCIRDPDQLVKLMNEAIEFEKEQIIKYKEFDKLYS